MAVYGVGDVKIQHQSLFVAHFALMYGVSIPLRSTIYHLLKNPDIKKRLLEEIDDRAREGKLSDPAKLEEADNMLSTSMHV